MDKGPNYYQILNVTRDSTISTVKKSYRFLSLELHPDKNRAADAADRFLQVKTAFDVLVDKERRREYNRLGDHGVALLAQTAIDHKIIIVQLIVYYCSSLIFAFLMTFTEPTGDAFQFSIFGLSGELTLPQRCLLCS
jgi:DnaJ-class molecular chaperone